MNPYAPPSRTAPADATDGAPLVSKPWRIWILQALLALQLGAVILATVSALSNPEVRALPLSALAPGLIRPVIAVPFLCALLLALQRRGPKPGVVAPVLASVWWLVSVATLALGTNSDPDLVSPLKPADAPSASAWMGAVIVHLILLWLVASTWLHQKTRAYLGQKA